MTLNEAIEQKIERVRRPEWNGMAYMKIPYVNDRGEVFAGVWYELYDPPGQYGMGNPENEPIQLCALEMDHADDDVWEEHKGQIVEEKQ
jgi:hypothetical protein